MSLRGLGSTAASRTLVVSDEVPLNDPFGGWIHWNEIPLLAIDHVELMRGGAADLYGSSAIGGVVDVVPVTAVGGRCASVADAGGRERRHRAGRWAADFAARRRLAVLAAASGLADGRLCSHGAGVSRAGRCAFECDGRERPRGVAHAVLPATAARRFCAAMC